jgi:folate-dependent phosphoribosylglycinamide formyltransferase PurN
MIRLAILLSGFGTTAGAILTACQKGTLIGIQPVVIISNRPEAQGLLKAKSFNIPIAVVNPKQLLEILRSYKADIVSQNGWLPLTPPDVIAAYKGKIINQHPGPLDPGYSDFGGKGMYGKRVTAARIAYAWMSKGDYWTEATTHIVTAEYDKGQIIRTEKLSIPVVVNNITSRKIIDTTNEIAAKLLPLEHKNVLITLQEYVKNRKFSTLPRKKRLIPQANFEYAIKAKKLAAELFPKG